MDVHQQAVADCNEFKARLSRIPAGHFVRLLDNKKRVIAIVSETVMPLVVGETQVSRFSLSDEDAGEMRILFKEYFPEDLGSYESFVTKHRAHWDQLLRLPNRPRAGLPMVRAIDYLVRNNIPVEPDEVALAMNQYLVDPANV